MPDVKIEVWGEDVGEDDEVLLSDLTAAIAKIPPEYIGSARLRVGYTEYSVPLEISYTRPETDGERQKRERDERERQAERDRAQFERDRAEFLRLKAKFEGRQ